MVADKGVCTPAKYGVTVYTADFNDIVCNKTVTSFYKFKGRFRFTNTGMSCKENAYTVNFNKYTMKGFCRRECICKNSDKTF